MGLEVDRETYLVQRLIARFVCRMSVLSAPLLDGPRIQGSAVGLCSLVRWRDHVDGVGWGRLLRRESLWRGGGLFAARFGLCGAERIWLGFAPGGVSYVDCVDHGLLFWS